jgi:large subunit ribosomal protein L17
MKHHKAIRKFGRVKKVRSALMRSLAVSFIEHGKLITTEAKAKELRPYIEKLITHGKTKSIQARRLVTSRLGVAKAGKKLIDEVGPRYVNRNGGYTRIIKLSKRSSDASPMAQIELV